MPSAKEVQKEIRNSMIRLKAKLTERKWFKITSATGDIRGYLKGIGLNEKETKEILNALEQIELFAEKKNIDKCDKWFAELDILIAHKFGTTPLI